MDGWTNAQMDDQVDAWMDERKEKDRWTGGGMPRRKTR